MASIKSYIQRKNIPLWAMAIVSIWIFIAIFSPFLSNNVTIISKSKDGWSFLSQRIDAQNLEFKINPLIHYKYSDIDNAHSLAPPFSDGMRGIHILGTDKVGRDVAAGMIHGARIAAIIVVFTLSISLVLGLLLGIASGYYGDKGIRLNLVQIGITLLLSFYAIYYFFVGLNQILLSSIAMGLLLTMILLFILNHLHALPLKKIGIPLDFLIMRAFEIREGIPSLFLILSIVAIVTVPSLFTVIIILVVLFWMTIGRHSRMETLKIKEEDYIKSAKTTGMSDLAIIVRHILPNVLPPIMIVIAFTTSSIILVESTLSFLGIGIPVEQVSWGKILAASRFYPKAWWLAIFPGLAIFLIIYSFNVIGEKLSQANG